MACFIALLLEHLCGPAFADDVCRRPIEPPPPGSGGVQELAIQSIWMTTGSQGKTCYDEFTNIDICEVKHYKTATFHEHLSTTVVDSGNTTTPYDDPVDDDGCQTKHGTGAYNTTTTTTFDGSMVLTTSVTCAGTTGTNIYSGTYTQTQSQYDYRSNTVSCGPDAHNALTITIDFTNGSTISATLTGGTNAPLWTGTKVSSGCQTVLTNYDDIHGAWPTGTFCTGPDTNSTLSGMPLPSQVSGTETVTQTVKTDTKNPPPNGGTDVSTITLSDEFTTCDLINLAKCFLGQITDPPWDHQCWGWLADQRQTMFELDQAQYWFTYPTEPWKLYTIKKHYTVISTGCALGYNVAVDNVEVLEAVVGDGQEHTETNSMIPVCYNNLIGYQVDGASAPLGGKGEITIAILDSVTIQDMTQSSSCASCGGVGGSGNLPGAGRFFLSAGNAEADFNLGVGRQAQPAGELQFNVPSPSAALSTAAGLSLLAPTNLVTVITNSGTGALRQLGASQCLVDLLTVNSYQYQMVFYPTNAFTPASDHVTLLSTNGLTPLVTWTVLNPDGVTNTNRLEIIEMHGSQQITNMFTWNAASNQWQLDSGTSLSRTLMTESVNPALSNRTETVQTINPANGAVLFQTVSLYQVFAWGEGLVQQITGTGPAALTNTWSYTSDSFSHPAANGNFNRPVQLVRGDGSWELYHSYDDQGRLTEVRSPYGNTPPGPYGSQRIKYYSYDPLTGFGDDTNLFPRMPRIVTESVNGGTVSRSYFIASNNMTISIQAAASSAVPFDSAVLCTTNWYFPTNTANAWRLQRTDHPDGTMDLYSYATNAAGDTNIVYSGVANAGRTTVVDGTETITVLDPVMGAVLSRKSIDIASGITTSSEVYSSFDSVGRAGLITYLDGTTAQKSYDCCHLTSETDRDGRVTSYTYDLLKRLVTTSRNGITTSNVYDAANHVIQTVRFGADGSAITNSSAIYDDASRQYASIDALSHTNYYTNFCSGTNLVRQTTYADGSTRIETYATDGTLASVAGTATSPVNYLESTADSCVAVTEVKISATGGTNEWVLTETDAFGHQVKTIYASGTDTPTAYQYYNIFGQLTNTVDPDGVSRLYAYNAKGEQALTVLDMNRDYNIDFGGDDRITYVTNDVVVDNGVNVTRKRTYVYTTSGSTASNLVSLAETSVDGLKSWNVLYNNGVSITNSSQTTYDATHGYRVVINTSPDGSTTVTTNVYGRLVSVTCKDANGTQLSQTLYSYDPHGRQNLTTDARNGTSTNFFNNADQTSGTATPAPGAGQASQVVSNIFDAAGRVIATKLPDNTWVTNDYVALGTLKRSYGSRTYPVGYGYDAQSRMITMTNWSAFPNTGARVTTWNYDPYRGYLSSKQYPDGSGPNYSYTDAARLHNRQWARGTSTTYSYNNAGELSAISYDDGSTPGVAYGYDRRGRQTSVTVGGSMTTTLDYNDAGNLLNESYSGGPLDGLSVTNGYDALLRRTNLVALNGSTVLSRTTYGYDAASRLFTVSDGTNTAGYSYLANSPLVSQIGFTNAGALRMTTTKNYDFLNRLTSISSANASSVVLDSHAYAYNSANQRTAVTNTDSSRWAYGYDSLGQVTSGNKYWSDSTPVAGQQFGYSFDNIGNRTATQVGGDQWGANLLSASYSANTLNQYTSRTVPGALDIIGAATNMATVTVNDYPTTRKGSYYRAEIPVANGSSPVYQPVTNLAVLNRGTSADLIGTSIGNVLVPPATQSFTYDTDGNLTDDSLWTYVWDGENRLIQMTSGAAVPAAARKQLSFTYDDQGRRIQKIVSTWNGSAFVPQSTNLFLYEGWNLVSELNGGNNALIRNYFWGNDQSEYAQDGQSDGPLLLSLFGTNCLATFDDKGDICSLINASTGDVQAQYEYDLFGSIIRMTGILAQSNPLRFSGKYQDEETEAIYYGFRYYTASSGRWLSRDPLAEKGGLNLYALLCNVGIGRDTLGLSDADIVKKIITTELELNHGYEIAAQIGALNTFDILLTEINKCTIVLNSDSDHTSGTTIYFKDIPSAGTALHELSHAYLNWSLSKLRRDEGVAYGVEEVVAEFALPNLRKIEKELKQSPCGKFDKLSRLWWDYWKDFGHVSGPGYTGGNYGVFFKKNFKFDAEDFKNLAKIYRLQPNCGIISKTFNSYLEQAGCCFRFTCAASADRQNDIAAGVDIDEVLK